MEERREVGKPKVRETTLRVKVSFWSNVKNKFEKKIIQWFHRIYTQPLSDRKKKLINENFAYRQISVEQYFRGT